MEEWYHYPLLVVVGFAVGFINTVAGGGSLLSLPTLIFLGLPAPVANGTNRVAIVIQTALATAGFKSKGISTYPFNVYLGISAFFGSILGAYIAIDVKGETFNRILAIIMVMVVLIIIFKPKMRLEEMQERLTGKYLWLSIVAFFFFGIYGGFINAGLGFILAIGNGTGAWVASRFSVKKGDGFIKTFLIVAVIVMAIKLWFF
ncbi:MAG: sulfite exporter TauE/SafE family protein [Allomuricauda sp.]